MPKRPRALTCRAACPRFGQRPRLKKRLIIAGCVCAVLLAFWLGVSRRSPVSIAWQVPLDVLKSEQPAVGADGSVYVRVNRRLLAFDRGGKQRWISPNGPLIESTASIGLDGTIYARASFGSNSPRGYKENSGLLALRTDGKVKWWFNSGDGNGGVREAPAALDGQDTIYFSAQQNSTSRATLFAMGADQEERWRFDSDFRFGGDLVVAADGSILATFGIDTNGARAGGVARIDKAGNARSSIKLNLPAAPGAPPRMRTGNPPTSCERPAHLIPEDVVVAVARQHLDREKIA
jgi:hypothetical protein